MKSPDGNYFNIDRHLTLTLTLLIALILGGNGLVILQFEKARLETDHLTGVSQQLIAVLRLQEGVLSFHQRLNELAESKDARRLVAEAKPLRATLLEQTQQTRNTLAYLPPEFLIDPAFLSALDAFETTLPSQLQDITSLATVGDWEAVRFRLDNELERMETTTSTLVKSIGRELDKELPHAVTNMRNAQGRILFIVPATALSTVFIAAFFGWAIARRILELRLEERVRERTRIARELHDTLLQSFQSVLLKFSAVTYLLPDRPEAQKTLEDVIEQARGAVIDGRDALQGLRSSTVTSNDLARAIRTLGEGLAADQTGGNFSDFHVHVEGPPRNLSPLVWGEVYRIAGEALRNAFRHAQAGRIEVDIRYDPRQLRVRVKDDGKGIDPKIIDAGGRAGHHGLPGMRERASMVGGKFAVRSELNSGTEVETTIPASVAYAKSPAARWWSFGERGTGQRL
jgi:signal transduction histidine kinase